MTQSNKSPNACRVFYMIVSNIVRLITLGYAALAIYAFFEIRVLLQNSEDEDSFQVEDGILYIPLVMCLPSDLPFLVLDGSPATNSSSTSMAMASVVSYYGEKQCRQLDYLISAVAASLVFAAAAAVIYVFIDCLARSGCFGSVTTTGSAGMGLFLSFVLAQAGISVGALAEQSYFWVDYFESLVDQLDLELKVQSYSNLFILITTALSGFGVAFLVLLDLFFYRCCCMDDTMDNKRRHDEEEEARKDRMDAELGMQYQSQRTEEVAHSHSSMDDVEVASSPVSESERPPWATSVFTQPSSQN